MALLTPDLFDTLHSEANWHRTQTVFTSLMKILPPTVNAHVIACACTEKICQHHCPLQGSPFCASSGVSSTATRLYFEQQHCPVHHQAALIHSCRARRGSCGPQRHEEHQHLLGELELLRRLCLAYQGCSARFQYFQAHYPSPPLGLRKWPPERL